MNLKYYFLFLPEISQLNKKFKLCFKLKTQFVILTTMGERIASPTESVELSMHSQGLLFDH